MHPSALELGRRFFELYWASDFSRILDIGSKNVNGSLRDVAPPSAEYTGVDLEAGEGVDHVLGDPYALPFPDASFDMVVSTSCFEHDPMFWLTFLEACRVLRNQGLFYINAPSNGSYHTYPWDNWRFYPDSGLALQMWGRRSGQDVSYVESFIMTESAGFNDTVLIFFKGDISALHVPYISDQIPDAINVRRGPGNPITRRRDYW